jgi:predicted transcriptional regulator
MVTTIQISEELKKRLNERKISDKDTYEEVIWDMFEDTMELSAETRRHIARSRAEIAAGKVVPFKDVMKKAGI